jgi:hypothetical protein
MNDRKDNPSKDGEETFRFDPAYGTSFVHIVELAEHGKTDDLEREVRDMVTSLSFGDRSPLKKGAIRTLTYLQSRGMVPESQSQLVRDALTPFAQPNADMKKGRPRLLGGALDALKKRLPRRK